MSQAALQPTWGEQLHLALRRHGGLAPVVAQIVKTLGAGMGSRNTYGKLQDFPDPPTDHGDVLRAWLLLTAVGEQPILWGIDEDEIPPGFDRDRLRDLLRAASPWTTTPLTDAA